MAGGFELEDEPISAINVTPLVDVVLVLLVIFLITAPVIYQSAIKVKLPQAQSGEEAQKSPINFTVNSEGKLYWGDEEIGWVALEERLRNYGEGILGETAIISADETTPHGTVVKLMDLLRRIGLTKFALNVANGGGS